MSRHVPCGRFVWYDLMSHDPKAAVAFYTKALGWGTQEFAGGGEPYTMFTCGGEPLGGIMDLPPGDKGAPPHWLAYVSTPDTDDTVKRTVAMGGKALMPGMDIPTVGRFAVLADPQGARFACFTPGEEMPASQEPPKVGQFSWHELGTTDHVAAFGFYAELFGWRKTSAMDMGPAGTYQMFGLADAPLGGMYNLAPEMPGPPAWLTYVRIPDIKASIAAIEKLGGKLVNGPHEVPGGDQVAQLVDPQGATFAVHQTLKP